MEASTIEQTPKKSHPSFRLFRRIVARAVGAKIPAKNSTYSGVHRHRINEHDGQLDKQGGSEGEFLERITENLPENAPLNTRTLPTNIGKALEGDGLLQPKTQLDRLSSQTSATRKSSQCSCSSKSLQNLKWPSSSSRRLSIYLLPPDSLDLEELKSRHPEGIPRYVNQSPESDSEMEFFSFPPSNESHDQHPTKPAHTQDFQEFRASSSKAALQVDIPSESGSQEASSEVKSCKGTTSINRSSRKCAHIYLHLGIKAHEENNLKRSATLFRLSATEAGGCGLGMLMWALSLRHGWGCGVNTQKAYGWLQLSAETLVHDMEDLQSELANMELSLAVGKGADKKKSNGLEESLDDLIREHQAIMSELLLAAYELGQCLMRGWGCPKDKILAVKFFSLAANLGDPDAQLELAYCYETGKGVEKSSKQAAKYYRMVNKQGIEMMGFNWIWKEKRTYQAQILASEHAKNFAISTTIDLRIMEGLSDIVPSCINTFKHSSGDFIPSNSSHVYNSVMGRPVTTRGIYLETDQVDLVH